MEEAGLTGPRKILRASDEELRAAGLSRQKARYARALAASGIRYAELRTRPTDEVIATLVEVPGIGTWTAEIYAMFSLGRADVFAPGPQWPPDLLGGREAFVTRWGRANRLLTGPFETRDDARSLVRELRAQGFDSFAYTSPQGEEIIELK